MNHRKVLIVGYYHRKNLGDNVFEHVLTNYFQKRWPDSEYNFTCIDDLKEIPPDTSAVIFGGGDLVNDYFYRKIDRFIKNKHCPWYAVSIGIPYPQLIERGYLDRFDYIIHRNQEDKVVLSDRYGERTEWFPDMSFLLPWYHPGQEYEVEYVSEHYYQKKVGIFLSRSIYNRDDPDGYNRITNNLAKFLSKIAQTNHTVFIPGCGRIRVPIYELYLLPFCTDDKDNHDDRLINQDIYDKIMDYGELDNVQLINDTIHMDRIIPIFNSFHLTICTRFHAHMFSLLTQTPILSIHTTRKVSNLISEIGAEEYAIKMETHPTGYYPVDLDQDELMDKFLHLEETYYDYLDKLETLHTLYTEQTKVFVTRLDNLLFYGPRYVLPDEICQRALEKASTIVNRLLLIRGAWENMVNDMLSVINNRLAYVIEPENNHNKDINIREELIREEGAIGKYFGNDDSETKERIIEMISYELTGTRLSDYHYGLHQKVFEPSYNLCESCEWILGHKYNKLNNDNYIFLDNILYDRDDRRLNITHINKNLFTGYHRSGWNFVLDHMEEIHNPRGVIFDSYLDKTFGWEYDFLSLSQVIPYRKPWVGVFHHTSNKDYTENNLVKVFSRRNFIQSLNCCKGIIVLSKNNKEWIEDKLNQLYIKVPVLSLTHPTEILSDKLLFDYDLFKLNPAKKVIQIGAWLRNSYAIYDLDVPDGYHKFALKGKDMNNYFVTDDDMDNIENCVRGVACGRKERISGCMVDNKDSNKYIVGLLDNIRKNHRSVTVLDNISNDQYDQLLRTSVVFINLVDASAVNTILECVVRNTPILVNRLPATEEYLGSKYPLFYDNFDHANDLLSDRRNIKRAHKYLRYMDKTKFTTKHFLDSLVRSDLYQSL